MTPEQIVSLLTQINEKYNQILQNAKTIDEFAEQATLVASSYIPVRIGGVTKKMQIQKILDAIQVFNLNEIISVGELVIDGNDVTIPSGAQWKINGVTYFTSTDTTINVPFCETGKTRIDIIVATTSGTLVKYSGFEVEGVALRPNIPLNTVLLTEITVTDDSFSTVVNTSFKGEYETIEDLETAHPTANAGDSAIVDNSVYFYSEVNSGWFTQSGSGPGTIPTLPQVLAQGDRTIRLSDGDGETILELNDRGKLVYNQDGDFILLPAELYPVNTVLKIHNVSEVDLFCIPDVDNNPSIQVNGITVDEFSGITLRAGTAVLKKISGDAFSESWILTFEVIDFSKDALGLGSVDNTSDASKPVSTAQATAIATAQTNAQTYAKNYTDASRLKQPARFAVGTNVASLSGPITVDSNLVTTDSILLLAQTDQKENGPWIVNGSGTWTRPEDFRTGLDVSFCLIPVLAGTYAARFFVTGAGRIVATNNIVLQDQTFLALLTGISFSDGTDVTAANTVLQALGKLQKQLTDVRAAKEDKRSYMSQSSTRFLDNTTALQRIFNVGTSGNGSIAVTSGRKYRVRGWAVFSGLTSTSKSISFGILGTATASYVSGIGQGVVSVAINGFQMRELTSFNATQISSPAATTAAKIYVDLEFNCNGSGTFIPSILFSAAQSNMQVDSAYFDIVDIGASTANATSNIV